MLAPGRFPPVSPADFGEGVDVGCSMAAGAGAAPATGAVAAGVTGAGAFDSAGTCTGGAAFACVRKANGTVSKSMIMPWARTEIVMARTN